MKMDRVGGMEDVNCPMMQKAEECRSADPLVGKDQQTLHPLPLVDVYVAAIPEGKKRFPLSCKEREEEIAGISNERVQKEKYFVFRLLEYAVERSLGLSAKELTFKKNENGKWTADGCHFSLSHCQGAVAVAVSRGPVGVDIEREGRPAGERLAKRILTAGERALYDQTVAEERQDFLLERWTAKESLFKKEGGKTFHPAAYDSTEGGVRTSRVTLAGQSYLLSVATDTPEVLRCHVGADHFAEGMKRVLVIGCPGSGKSRLSKVLHDKTGLPLYHLDNLFWNADKTNVEKSVFSERLSEVLERDEWIIDGNYASTMEKRMAVCDTVIFLDYPTDLCLDGVKRRQGTRRSDMPWIETEQDKALIEFIKGYNDRNRPQVMALLEKYSEKRILIFKSREEADAFLRGVVL